MTLSERNQWAYGVAVIVTSGAYFVWLSLQLLRTEPSEIDYVWPLVWTLVASVVVHALGRGSGRAWPASESQRDERDREIDRRADALCFVVFSSLAAVPFIASLAGAHPFWFTNLLFAAYSLTAVLGVVLRAMHYRRGTL